MLIDILYCGVCHSDIHQVRDEWGNSIFPMVPGHEIIGRVVRVGDKVKKWKPGHIVGVGCFVDLPALRGLPRGRGAILRGQGGHVAHL